MTTLNPSFNIPGTNVPFLLPTAQGQYTINPTWYNAIYSVSNQTFAQSAYTDTTNINNITGLQGFAVTQLAPITLISGAASIIPLFDTVILNPNSQFNITNSHFTCTSAGYYFFTIFIQCILPPMVVEHDVVIQNSTGFMSPIHIDLQHTSRNPTGDVDVYDTISCSNIVYIPTGSNIPFRIQQIESLLSQDLQVAISLTCFKLPV